VRKNIGEGVGLTVNSLAQPMPVEDDLLRSGFDRLSPVHKIAWG